MNARDVRLLIEVNDECGARRGPCPRSLVPIALNARGEHSIAIIDAQINALIRDRYLDEVTEVRGTGLRLTRAGFDVLSGAQKSDSTPAPAPAPAPAPEQVQVQVQVQDDDALHAESYSLLLDSCEALARHQRADVHLLSLYQRIERHCRALYQRAEQQEAVCDD